MDKDSAKNIANYQKYKDELGKIKPEASNPKLQKKINELYRENSEIGSGSTADAVRYELKTGKSVKGKLHSQKAQNSIVYLERWLKKTPNASFSDKQIAKRLIKDMKNALEGN